MKALALKPPRRARLQQWKAVPKLKAFLSELRGLTTAASIVPSLSPLRGCMLQASKELAACIKKLERGQRGPSVRRSLKAR